MARASVISCFVGLILCCIGPFSFGECAAESALRLEAESYFDSHDTCGMPLQIVDCSRASNGHAVEVDCDGEWIDLWLAIPSPYTFSLRTWSAGSTGYVATFDIQIMVDDSLRTEVARDTLTTRPGSGIG